MANNAMWWVRYTDAKTGREEVLSLSSPDLANVERAHKRACDTARKRLAKRGVKAIHLRSQCVG